ncbi:MAG TPA: HEAT repeat domain-containing protein [Gemmatimonadaceae bacterium]|nr:HEAT repeat domain-containing protein [Gemmatimonadaceae bacterium]
MPLSIRLTALAFAAGAATATLGAQPQPMPPSAPPPLLAMVPHAAPPAPIVTHGAPRPRDDADSLYRAGRDALNRSEYRVAARLFRELRDRHPRSPYVSHAAYWEAFCLYRVGTTEDLRTARQVLRTAQAARFSEESMQADAVALAARIQSALAKRGDPEAIDSVRRDAQRGATCDREEMEVRVEALSALAQTDVALALPAVRKVLANRDKCTVELRRRAVYLLVRKPDTSALPALLDVVRGDPESAVRAYAASAMSRVPGPRADQALQEVLRTSTDERVQSAAVQAIAQRDDWRPLRTLIERADVRTPLRVTALQSISAERATADDAAWLRGLYPRMTDPDLKEAVAGAVGKLGGEANERWLVALASNANEPLRARTRAVSSLGRADVPIAEIARIYDASSERGMREHLVRLLGERKDEAAIDKLIDIVKTGTDPVVRRSAINALSRHRENAKVRRVFEELIG